MEQILRLWTLPIRDQWRRARTKVSASDPRRRQALWALLLLVPAPSLGVLAGLVFENSALGTGLWAAAKVWMVALPLLWLLRVDRKPLRWSPPTKAGLAAGALVGVVAAALIFAVFGLWGAAWIDPTGMRSILEPVGLTSKGIYLAAAAYWILCNSILEEYVYRWFIFKRAKTLWGSRWAVVASAAAFVLHHAIVLSIYFDWRVTVLACAGIFVGGVLWSMLYRKYGNIWAPYVSHAIIDVAVFAVGWVLLFG